MGKHQLQGKDLRKLGYPESKAVGIAIQVMAKHYKRTSKEEQLQLLAEVLQAPAEYVEHDVLGKIAAALMPETDEYDNEEIPLSTEQKPLTVYGAANIEQGALDQMYTAMKLPVTIEGALMPDAHYGYGLPIGGVLAARNAVIPFGVGVDIGCRMCLTVYDLPTSMLVSEKAKLKNLLGEHTRFGTNIGFEQPMDHAVLDRPEFDQLHILKTQKDKAWKQLGSSGGGNHFVEFGVVNIIDADNEYQLSVGVYLGILSHSGSRGLGANVAQTYTDLARQLCRLPKEAQHLAWLSLDSEEGMEYWIAMNLAGDYASACHDQIHMRLGKALGEKPLAKIENHHNFAWKENLADGSEAIVHRKGATPAGKGVYGIIPGSMTAPGYIVRGKGETASINSAAHGAGRKMSRRKALESITNHALKEQLQKHGVTLIGGGLDEAPMVYKDIDEVMGYQRDLVDVVGSFQPKIVRMEG